jgi:hypothetical protein
MTVFRSLARLAVNALLVASLAAPGGALADSHAISPLAVEEMEGVAEDDMMVAQSGDCYSVGERVAAQNGGTLARATVSTQGGQEVCVVVVLVPGKDGQRPRRAEIVVPLN